MRAIESRQLRDQGKKKPSQKGTSDQDLGNRKETKLAPSRMELVWEWGGVERCP